MEQTIIKRIEYLKTVKRAEIQTEIKRIIAKCADLSDCPDYDKAKKKQSEIELEIIRLEKGQAKGFFIDEIDWIFKYFDNDDFIRANFGKQFSIQDRIAIIIHSRKMSLNDKFADLQKVIESVEDELKDNVNKWISYKKDVLEYIKEINTDDIVFLITFDSDNVGNPKVFRSYDAVMNDDSARFFGISIERVFNDNARNHGKVGGIRFNSQTGEIVDVNLFIADMDANAPTYKSPLYDIQVELNCPFKPYDLIKLPLRDQFQVVGEVSDERINKAMKEPEWSPWKQSWLKMNMATFFSSSYDAGEIQVNSFTKLPFCLDDIRLVPENEMTVGQQKMIEYYKSTKQVEE